MTLRELEFPAQPLREQAASWLMRATSQDWTELDQAELDSWLARSEFHRASYWRLEAAWSEAARLAALRTNEERRGLFKNLQTPVVLKLAAASILVSLVAIPSFRSYWEPPVHTYATAVGGHRTLTLPDGSVIELNTDTVVKLTDDLSKRTVWLVRGEAFFQIHHDERHPFVIFAGSQKITDLGTKFLVHRDAEHVEVALLEGRAQIENADPSEIPRSTELNPGEVAIATNKTMSVTRRPLKTLANEAGWREGMLVFDDTALSDAISEFNRYNSEKIVLRGSGLADLKVNGSFPIHARNEFVDTARAVFGLRAEVQSNQIILSH